MAYTNKNGYGCIVLEPFSFEEKGKTVHVFNFSIQRYFQYEDTRHGQENKFLHGTKFNQIINNHCYNPMLIQYKTPIERNRRMNKAKEELEKAGYEVVIYNQEYMERKTCIQQADIVLGWIYTTLPNEHKSLLSIYQIVEFICIQWDLHGQEVNEYGQRRFEQFKKDYQKYVDMQL